MESFEDFQDSGADQVKENDTQPIAPPPSQDETESHGANDTNPGLDSILQEQEDTGVIEDGNKYPQLSNNPLETEKTAVDAITEDDEEEPILVELRTDRSECNL